MKKIRSIQIIFLGTLLTASFGSCKRFLDTPAPQQLSAQSVLSSEQGFKDALSAVYLQMGDQSLYGREMSMGLLSVMGRSYDTTINPKVGSLYYQGAAYNFQDPTVQAAIKAIWVNTYQCIGELNNLLSQVDSKKNLFTGNDYYDLKAESIALRAYLHFDLLRLFGPVQAGQNLSVPVLPYMKKLTPYAQPVNTTGDVLDSCIVDLNTAAGLFKDSAVTTAHLNYWGAKALLARIYLYEGDLADAQTYALQLIGSNKYPLATSNADALFSGEHIFNIYIFQNNLLSYLKSLFNTPTPMGLQTANQTVLYLNATTDWRKSGAFLDPTSNSTVGTTIMPKKLSSSVIGVNNVMPMIRMTEMYYIAAECAQQLNGDFTQATAWLDSVRVHRGVTKYGLAALPHDSITAELGREYRRELLGEGQVFYYFKRNNLPFAALPFQKVPPVANASYVLPKPE